MKPFKPRLNRPGLKTVHGFHGSNHSYKKNFKKIVEPPSSCVSLYYSLHFSFSALRSSISCLSKKFGSFFSSDREERATWYRENERSCWPKKERWRRKKRTEIHKHTAEDAQVKRRIEIHLRSWALHLKLSKKEVNRSFEL